MALSNIENELKEKTESLSQVQSNIDKLESKLKQLRSEKKKLKSSIRELNNEKDDILFTNNLDTLCEGDVFNVHDHIKSIDKGNKRLNHNAYIPHIAKDINYSFPIKIVKVNNKTIRYEYFDNNKRKREDTISKKIFAKFIKLSDERKKYERKYVLKNLMT